MEYRRNRHNLLFKLYFYKVILFVLKKLKIFKEIFYFLNEKH